MIVKEIFSKTIISKSKVFDYSINPYIGCEHGCTYCYAQFIKRYRGIREKWGSFAHVKINAINLLRKEIKKKKVGKVWLSGVCDPYQPLEKRYKLTESCLKILLENSWPVTIQTKSPLVLRDIEILKKFNEIEVGLTITTADEGIKEIFEPYSPTIEERIKALEKLHSVGIITFTMIAPILPQATGIITQLKGKVDYVLIDKMNYSFADQVYKKHNLEFAKTKKFFSEKKVELSKKLKKEGIPYQLLF